MYKQVISQTTSNWILTWEYLLGGRWGELTVEWTISSSIFSAPADFRGIRLDSEYLPFSPSLSIFFGHLQSFFRRQFWLNKRLNVLFFYYFISSENSKTIMSYHFNTLNLFNIWSYIKTEVHFFANLLHVFICYLCFLNLYPLAKESWMIPYHWDFTNGFNPFLSYIKYLLY